MGASTQLLKGGTLTNTNAKQGVEKYIIILAYTLLTFGVICVFLFVSNFFQAYKGSSLIDNIRVFDEKEQSGTATANNDVKPWNPNCSFWDCFNVYRCGQRDQGRINIYVYPLKDSSRKGGLITKEYIQILETVIHSEFYTSNPNEACLFLPSIDLLNQNMIDSKAVEKELISLDYWENGENHLIFNMIPGTFPKFDRVLDVSTEKAIILGGGLDSWTYRPGFDVSFPVWSPLLENFDQNKLSIKIQPFLLIAAQLNMLPRHKRILHDLAINNPEDLLFLKSCPKDEQTNDGSSLRLSRCSVLRGKTHETFTYPKVLSEGTFCLLSRSVRLGQPDLLEMLAYNCIPVIAANYYVLPFQDVIDWTLVSIRIRENDLYDIMERLRAISHTKILDMQRKIKWLFHKYFRDLPTITLTALNILNGRVFPHLARTNNQWNVIDTNNRAADNPLFLPMIPPKSQGFTAVILTYDRVESLFTLIQNLAVVSSLQSILVIWNNQFKAPPHLSMFPKILKPLKVIQTRINNLSNRFYPYDEIETEAILAIDDDIVMLTADELNFGYEVWREFPDRIVGFPSRIHIYNNTTMRWRYESEWTNQISMVLTGAAFYHKYWSYMYTNAMPGDIKNWVDEHMNCEDIAMNFLVANVTKKPPIKVAPRKKFKCPECTNTEMLSADLNHMLERSACIDRFARIYGHMPLKSVEFRADPVLYKDNIPEKLKRFNDIGSL